MKGPSRCCRVDLLRIWGGASSWRKHDQIACCNICEWLSKPLLTLETIQPLRFPFIFSTFGFLGIMWYRSGNFRLEFLAFLTAIRNEKKIDRKRRVTLFEISHRFTWSWSPMAHDWRHNESNIRGFNELSCHVVPNPGLNWALVKVVLQIIGCT